MQEVLVFKRGEWQDAYFYHKVGIIVLVCCSICFMGGQGLSSLDSPGIIDY